MKTLKISAFLLILCGFYSFPLFADTFQSEVRHVNPDAGTVSVVKKDPMTGIAAGEEIAVQVSAQSILKNFAALAELRKGDEVKVDGKWNEQKHFWEASSISLAKFKLEQ